MVFDEYWKDSLKAATRSKRGKGIRRHVEGNKQVPSNWQEFLRIEMHSNNRLHHLLGVCFSAMLIHGYMPQGLMDTKIIPLVKNKCGKLSDKNNYRPVAISNSLSKVFELILLDRCEEYLWTSGNQSGFKANHSTEMCICIT